MRHAFEAQVLNKYPAQYEVCGECEFLRALQPHWLDEAYSSAIAAADTGLVMRNISLAFKVASTLYWVFGERGKGQYLDAAGGYGMLTRMMRDLGFDFYWSDKHCDNLMARGFEYSPAISNCQVVTAMEVMEHLTDPLDFVETTLKDTGAHSLIFSTELYDGTIPSPDWWYYTFETGQHIGFFSRTTLNILGNKLGLKFISSNGLHILSRRSLNQNKLFLATRPLISKGSSLLIRRKLGSKTMSDHLAMMHSN